MLLKWDAYIQVRATTEGFHSVYEFLQRIFEELMNCTYWRRLWVLQEICLSPVATLDICCGKAVVPWKTWHTNSRLLGCTAYDWTNLGTVTFEDRCQDRFTFARSYFGVASLKDGDPYRLFCQSFREIVQIMKLRAECADRRDYIFALLALVQNGQSFDVNYGMSYAELFWETFRFFRT